MRLGAAATSVCALLLVAGCQSGQGTAGSPVFALLGQESADAPAWPAASTALAGDQPSLWWPVASSRELAPTGIEVVARSQVEGMAADGQGSVWLYGPWLVARVDPATGGTQVWDVSDDLAFAGTTRVRPARSGGVWLVSNEAVRLFDGQRFQRDLPVPDEFRGGLWGAITDVVDLGSQVWVSSAAGVARCSGGAWSWVARGRIERVTALGMDGAGSVWAAGQVTGHGRRVRAVFRFDGSQEWAVPGGDSAPGYADDFVVDGDGRVLVRSFAALHRFVDGSWKTVAELPDRKVVGGDRDGLHLTTDRPGATWVAGEDAVARQQPSGRWRVTARRQGGVGPLVGLALVSGDVLVTDSAGLLRVEGDRLRRVGRSPCSVLTSRAGAGEAYGPASEQEPGRPLRIGPDGLLAVSTDELWATVDQYPVALHFSGGRWQEVDLGSPVAWHADPVLASDGAVWIRADGGPVRIAGEHPERIQGVQWMGTLRPAPDGGVWVVPSPWYGWWYAEGAAQGRLDGRSLGRLETDGTGALVPLPDDVWALPAVFPASDGSLWATSCQDASAYPCPNPPDVLHWDGQWSRVAYPGYGISLVGVGGQSLWASLFPAEDLEGPTVLASFSQGTWTTFPEAGVLDSLMVGPDGSACGMDQADRSLVCVDGRGRIQRWDVGLGGDIRIAPDGSVWLVDSGLVARLPVSLPLPAAAPEQ